MCIAFMYSAYCYVNGVLKQTIDFTVTNSNQTTLAKYTAAKEANPENPAYPALGSVGSSRLKWKLTEK